MTDQGLDKILIVLFGIGGIAILICAWVQSMPQPERILTVCIGSVGLLGAIVRALLLRFTLVKK